MMTSAWQRWCAALLTACSFLSVFTGTAVTSNEERPFYALGQTHIWFSVAAGVLTALVVVGNRFDKRAWLRQAGWGALAVVLVQAVLGFQPPPQAPGVRIAHASLAQFLFPATIVIAWGAFAAGGRAPQPVEGASALRFLASWAPVVVLAQVALGILFRHGALGIGLHLAGAFIIAFFILGVALSVIYRPEHASLHLAARMLLTIASVQVFLGLALFSMQSMEVDPEAVILVTMIHAATAALTLAATVMMAVLIRRYVSAGPVV